LPTPRLIDHPSRVTGQWSVVSTSAVPCRAVRGGAVVLLSCVALRRPAYYRCAGMSFSIPILSHSRLVIPIPFPKFMHCDTYSHSHSIPENSFPFPPIPIPANDQITNESKHFKPNNVCNVFCIHRLQQAQQTPSVRFTFSEQRLLKSDDAGIGPVNAA